MNRHTKRQRHASQYNIPQLRFPEFIMQWERKKLINVARIITGSTPSTTNKEYYNGEFQFVSPADLNAGRYVTKTKTTLTELGFKKGRKISKNSVLFVCIGSTIGKVGQTTDMCITNQQINALEAKAEFSNDFIYSILSKNGIKIKRLAGTQAVPQLNKTDFSNLKFSFPTLPEQQRIATFLTAVDEKLTALKKKKDLLEQYKKGIMQKLFSQQIRFKPDLSEVEGDENGNEFPEWEKKKLGEAVKFSKGKGISKSDINENGKTRCIRYGELYTHYNEVIDYVSSKTNLELKELVFSESNDIIIPASGETQIDIATASCVIDDGIALSGDLNIMKFKGNGVFLSYYLNNAKKIDIARLAQGISVVHLYASQLASLTIYLPCLEEQTRIANFLSAIDKKINETVKQIEATAQWKKGLLQQMFV